MDFIFSVNWEERSGESEGMKVGDLRNNVRLAIEYNPIGSVVWLCTCEVWSQWWGELSHPALGASRTEQPKYRSRNVIEIFYGSWANRSKEWVSKERIDGLKKVKQFSEFEEGLWLEGLNKLGDERDAGWPVDYGQWQVWDMAVGIARLGQRQGIGQRTERLWTMHSVGYIYLPFQWIIVDCQALL